MSLDLAAMTGPVFDATGIDFHPYNCHMAVIHWAMIATGKTGPQAAEAVQSITREYCPHCKGLNNMKASLQAPVYSKLFCQTGAALDANTAAVGDVVILPDPRFPTHSMVIVSINAGNIGVRGYNNTGTFGPPSPFLQYDAATRILANRIAPNLNPVFRIRQQDFLTKARNLSRLFSIHTKAHAV